MTSTCTHPPARRAFASLTALVVGLGLAFGPAPTALAGSDPRDDVSSVDQYVEDIPTASGSTPTGGAPGEGDDAGRPLPADVATALDDEGGTDANALGRLATMPALGAPRDGLRAGPDVQRALAENRSIGAAVGTAASGTTPALYALVVLLVGITVALLAVAVRRAGR